MYGILNDSGTEVIARFTAPMTVRSNQPVFVSDALSLKRFITKSTAQRWEIETNVEPLQSNANELMTNLVTRGASESVLVRVPQNYAAKLDRTANLAITPSQAVGAGSSQIPITSSGKIPKGTFIKFQNHNKLYMTTTDFNSSGVLNIFPYLRSGVDTNVQIYYKDDVQVNFLYDTDVVFGMVYSDGILMETGTIRLLEKL